MSSLRPVITIMILAAVGVVLYMKINETPPVIPAGVGEWSADPLQIGGDAGLAGMGTTSSPPAYAPGEPPAFTPGAVAPSTSKTPPGDEAPAWNSPPLVLGEAPKAANPGASGTNAAGPVASADAAPATPSGEATIESSPVARSADPSVALPAMPPLPSTNGDAPPLATGDTAPTYTPPAATEQAASGASGPSPAPSGGEEAPAIDVPLVGNEPTTPTPESQAGTDEPPSKTSNYATARTAVQGALDRGELAQALFLLSNWYGDPALTPAESDEVDTLLSQLAGSVIYEGPPAHRLEQAYIVQSGETLHEVAAKYNVPWQLLAKINGIADSSAVQPGQELKVVRGPFSATIELGKRKMTLMLDQRYAGKFTVELDPASAIEVGEWTVGQKLLTPTGAGLYGRPAGATEDRSLLLASSAGEPSQTLLLSGPGGSEPAGSAQGSARTIRLKSADIEDVYDILSVGSRVTVRR